MLEVDMPGSGRRGGAGAGYGGAAARGRTNSGRRAAKRAGLAHRLVQRKKPKPKVKG